MNKKKKKISDKSQKKMLMYVCFICVAAICIFGIGSMIYNSYQLNDTSYLSSNKQISKEFTNGSHIRYITKDTQKSLPKNSEWRTNKKKEEKLNKILNTKEKDVKSYDVQLSED